MSQFWTDMDQMRIEQERTFQSIREGKCGCITCIEGRGEIAIHMVVCPTCGNKRCPKATNHDLACTNSNDPGQTGSAYYKERDFDQRDCPKCGLLAVADFVDNGVGMERSGPYCCEACGWVEDTSELDTLLPDNELR